jgi:hypothetical protein
MTTSDSTVWTSPSAVPDHAQDSLLTVLVTDTLRGVPVGFGRYLAKLARPIWSQGAGRVVYSCDEEREDTATTMLAAITAVAAAATAMRVRRSHHGFGAAAGDRTGSPSDAAIPGASVPDSSDIRASVGQCS